MTRSLIAAGAAWLAMFPSITAGQAPRSYEVLRIAPIYHYSFMQPPDPSLPSHVILLSTIAAPSQSTGFPVASYPHPSGYFWPARVAIGARRARAQTFTVIDATGARIVEAREVWQMGWTDESQSSWREVVPLPRDLPPTVTAIALRGRHAGVRLLRIERSSAGVVGSDNDLESCLGPSSAVARRFSIADRSVHVACYERGFATARGAETPVSLLSNGRVIWRTRAPFHLVETPDGIRVLVEDRPGRWRMRRLPS